MIAQLGVTFLNPNRTPVDEHRVDVGVQGVSKKEEGNGGSAPSEDNKRGSVHHRTTGRREERAIEKVTIILMTIK